MLGNLVRSSCIWKKNTLHDVKKGNKLENNKRKQNGTPPNKENNLYN